LSLASLTSYPSSSRHNLSEVAGTLANSGTFSINIAFGLSLGFFSKNNLIK